MGKKTMILLAALALGGPALAATPAGAPLAPAVSREDMLDLENCELKVAALKAHEAEVLRKYQLGPNDRLQADGTIQREAPKAAPKKEKK